VKEPVKIGTMQSKRYGKVAIWKGQYMSNGAMSISLVDQEGPLATLSVNMDHGQMQDHHSNELPENCFYAKTWQENEEIAAEALASGWFKERPDLPVSHSGFVGAPAWELLDKQDITARPSNPYPDVVLIDKKTGKVL
jgi:hypothetical protein